MKRSTKLFMTIIAMCLVVTLGVIGIFAVKTLNMNVGGNINFFADGLEVEVSAGVFKTTNDADYSNILADKTKLQAFSINTDTKLSDIQSKIDSWANLDLKLDSKGDAVLCFDVKNNMTSSIYVYVTVNLGTNLNNNMDILENHNGTEIAAGKTQAMEITFDILDTNINAGLTGFNIGISFSKESIVKTQNKINTENGEITQEIDYFYVEMGTYKGQPVRWRYVADKDGNVYTQKTAPRSLKGYYVQDTPTTNYAFLNAGKYSETTFKHISQGHENINSNDYGLSDVRKYITNEGVGGYINLLNISKNDAIYSIINPRSLADLYTNITNLGTTITQENTSYCMSLTGEYDIRSQKDKLWLLSYEEALKFFTTDDDRKWSSDFDFWLRGAQEPYKNSVCNVYGSGKMDEGDACFYYNGIRAAFKI